MSDTLKIILDAVTGPFHKDMDEGARSVQKFSREGQTSLKEFKKLALGAFSVGAAVSFGQEIVRIGTEVHDMSRQLQMSGEDLQAYQELFRQNRVEVSEFGTAITALRVKQQEALEGDEMAIEMFEKLGISMDTLASKMAPDLFRDVATGMSEMTDQTAAFDAVSKVFGEDTGRRLIGIFEDLNGLDFEAYKNGLRESGKIMDEEVTERLSAAESKIKSFQNQVKIFVGNTILGKGAEALEVYQAGAQARFEQIRERSLLQNVADPMGLFGGKGVKARRDEILMERADERTAKEQEAARDKNRREEMTREAQQRTKERTEARLEAAAAEEAEKERERIAAQREKLEGFKRKREALIEKEPLYVSPAERVGFAVRNPDFKLPDFSNIDALTAQIDQLASTLERKTLVVADY